jgi:hypothetical protein
VGDTATRNPTAIFSDLEPEVSALVQQGRSLAGALATSGTALTVPMSPEAGRGSQERKPLICRAVTTTSPLRPGDGKRKPVSELPASGSIVTSLPGNAATTVGTFREHASRTLPSEAIQRPEGGEMIPAHMLHEAERSRTKREQRASDPRRSELAAAFARLGSVLIVPFRVLRRLGQHAPAELTTGRTVPPASKGQLLDGVGVSAAHSSLHSFPRWWTFDGCVPSDGHALSDETLLDTLQ